MAQLSAFTDSVPDDHAPEVLVAYAQRVTAPLLPEQGPDLVSSVVPMDDATFTTPSVTIEWSYRYISVQLPRPP